MVVQQISHRHYVILLTAVNHEHASGEHVPIAEVADYLLEQSCLSDSLLAEDVELKNIACFAAAEGELLIHNIHRRVLNLLRVQDPIQYVPELIVHLEDEGTSQLVEVDVGVGSHVIDLAQLSFIDVSPLAKARTVE